MLATLLLLTALQNGPVKADTLQPPVAVSPQAREPEAFMVQQVTYVSEFINRFNHQITANGRAIPDSLQNTDARKGAIGQLFDRFSSAALNKTSFLRTHKNEFIEQVCDAAKPVRLTFLSNDLYATVRVQTAWQGKEQPVDFYLKSATDRQGHAWKILDAQAPFLNESVGVGANVGPAKRNAKTAPDTARTRSFIPLNAQETAFLNLYNQMRDRHDLLQLAAQPNNASPSLTRLAQLVVQGQVTPVHTDYPTLYLPVANGWIMQVNFTNRKHEQSGWLITDLYQLTGTDPRRLPAPFLSYFRPQTTNK